MNSVSLEPFYFVDTHCHLSLCSQPWGTPPAEHLSIEQIIQDAAAHRVTTIVDIATTLEESHTVLLTQTYDPRVTVLKVVGLHPDTATADPVHALADLTQLVQEHRARIAGIGECGMDFYRPGYHAAWQEQLFCGQIELSITHNKALVVHSRNCPDETLAILDRYRADLKRVIMHCYSYDVAMAHQLADRGWFLGIGGTVTYPKNNALRQAVKSVGLEHIVLETDAPFLAPQVVRGTRNAPKNIPLIAAAIAQELSGDSAMVAYHTTKNAEFIFTPYLT